MPSMCVRTGVPSSSRPSPAGSGCTRRPSTSTVPRVLVVGPSGSGKTTLAARLLLDGADVQGDESVLVRRDASLAVPRALHLKPGYAPLLPELAALAPSSRPSAT